MAQVQPMVSAAQRVDDRMAKRQTALTCFDNVTGCYHLFMGVIRGMIGMIHSA